jgi:hypothetical protein
MEKQKADKEFFSFKKKKREETRKYFRDKYCCQWSIREIISS